MASSSPGTNPMWHDGVSLTALLYRTTIASVAVNDQGTAAAVSPGGGVFARNSPALQVTAPVSGMTVNVSPGYCSVPATTAAHGTYIFGLLQSAALTVAANSTGSARQDYVLANVQDVGSPSSFAQVEYVTGTTVPPAVPANSIILAQVSVPDSAASIVTGDIADLRTQVVPPGGVLPVATALASPAVSPYQFLCNTSTGQLVRGTGTAAKVQPVGFTGNAGGAVVNTSVSSGQTPGSPSSFAWGIGYGEVNSGAQIIGFGGGGSDTDNTLTTQIEVSFSADGKSDYQFDYKWALTLPAEAWSGFGSASVTIGQTLICLLIDGQVNDTIYLAASDSPSVNAGSGGSASWYTSASLGTTLSKGSHTAALGVATENTFVVDGFNVCSGASVGASVTNAPLVFSPSSAWLSAQNSENCSLLVTSVPPA